MSLESYEFAKDLEEQGIKSIPCEVQKGSCEIKTQWRDCDVSVDLNRSMFHKQNGVAVICGSRSKRLITVDADQKHDSTFTLSGRLLEAIKFAMPDLYDILYIEETRSGGLHLIYFLAQQSIEKFIPARTIEIDKNGKEAKFALIEVLGDGQIVFVAPTPGYKVLQGSFDEIPTIDMSVHEELMRLLETFNELPDEEIEEVQEFIPTEEDDYEDLDQRPGSIYNRNCDVHKVAKWLQEEHGWKVAKKLGEKYWFTRPGKDKGISATWNYDGRRLFCCFSSSSEFETHHKNGKMKGHTAFSLLARLECNGSYRMATAIVVQAGYVPDEDWGEIEKLKVAQAESLNVNKLLGTNKEFKKFILEYEECFQVAPEMVLLPALSIMSLALCGAVKLRINDSWIEDVPQWTITVANASERKSPVLTKLCLPFYNYFDDFGKNNGSAIRKQSRKRGILKNKIEALEDKLRKNKKGTDEDEILNQIEILENRIEAFPKMAQVPDMIKSDITAEALGMELMKNGEVCGLISGEATPIEIACGLYSGKPNLNIYLSGYSVERVSISRVGREGGVIEQPRIVLGVMMQTGPMKELSESIEARGKGFIGRTLFACPKSKIGNRKTITNPVSESSSAWWRLRINSALDLKHRLRFFKNDKGELEYSFDDPKIIDMTKEAKKIFNDARVKNEESLAIGSDLDDDTGWGGKLMGNIARLALNLHFLEGRGIDDKLNESTMKDAIAWIEPLEEHYHTAMGSVGTKPIDKYVQRACDKIIKDELKSPFSLNDLYRKLKTRNRNKIDHWEPVFVRMVELNYIRIKEEGDRKPKRMITLHPNFIKVVGK